MEERVAARILFLRTPRFVETRGGGCGGLGSWLKFLPQCTLVITIQAHRIRPSFVTVGMPSGQRHHPTSGEFTHVPSRGLWISPTLCRGQPRALSGQQLQVQPVVDTENSSTPRRRAAFNRHGRSLAFAGCMHQPASDPSAASDPG
jgi:hypothetical protein